MTAKAFRKFMMVQNHYYILTASIYSIYILLYYLYFMYQSNRREEQFIITD